MKKLFYKQKPFSSPEPAVENATFSEYPHGGNRFPRRKKLTRKHAFGGIFFAGSLSLAYATASMFIGPIPPEPSSVDAALPMNLKFQVVSDADIPLVPPPVIHVKTPDAVKAAYMSSCVASTPDFRDRVINIVNTTEINSLVVDIKDYSGRLSYTPSNKSLLQEPDPDSCRIRNIRELIDRLHSDNIYVIGRVAVFQDPYFVGLHPDLAIRKVSTGGIWKDRKGLSWIDAASQEMWEYTVAIARDAYSQGFDEMNFDYVRFPSDGEVSDMLLPISATTTKSEVILNFFSYLSDEMKTSGITTSADLFGMTTTANDDMNIGQLLETALPYFDYIAPMVYPSHYPNGFNGWSNPNAHPYELIKFVMDSGSEKAIKASTTPLKLRPWLQDFSLGTPSYGKAEVEEQIRATYDAGLTSWMLWDPSNKYAGGALLRE
ncbi:MAG: putative glycoside hydrolase [Candidatus Paceibacterota bacterium]|jgi:hypothetical protein|nr:putative glycoside hydrolase [Candidatus Paceibacterota bacterium]